MVNYNAETAFLWQKLMRNNEIADSYSIKANL
jgi:hypothetical protein